MVHLYLTHTHENDISLLVSSSIFHKMLKCSFNILILIFALSYQLLCISTLYQQMSDKSD